MCTNNYAPPYDIGVILENESNVIKYRILSEEWGDNALKYEFPKR